MADENKNDKEPVDDTAKKAADIGKDMGVTEDKEPEYEIQEVPDDVEDKTIAKERNPKSDNKDHQHLSNREKRQIRKKKINERFNEKDAIIQSQQQQLSEMQGRLAQIDGRLSGINKAEVDKALNTNIEVFTRAEADHSAAFTDGDGAKATKALQVMYDAKRNIEHLQGMKQQIERSPAQAAQQQQPDALIVNKAKEWGSRNSWYSPDKGDTDSEVAKGVSAALVKEGYDARTDEFWDELDNRLEKYMPDKVIAAGEDEDDDYVEPEKKPVVRKRAAPPVNGGSNRGDMNGKKTITLPTSYINMLKANGIYDDKVRLKKILADRERILRESGS